MQFNGNGLPVLGVAHAHTLAHGFPLQQMHQPVAGRALGHTADAEAAGGSRSHKGGKDLAGDPDDPLIACYFYHSELLPPE